MLEALFSSILRIFEWILQVILLVSYYNDEAKTTVTIIALARFCHTYRFVLHMSFAMPRVVGTVTCCCYGCWY